MDAAAVGRVRDEDGGCGWVRKVRLGDGCGAEEMNGWRHR